MTQLPSAPIKVAPPKIEKVKLEPLKVEKVIPAPIVDPVKPDNKRRRSVSFTAEVEEKNV